MSTDPTHYSRYYYGPEDPEVYQDWLTTRADRLKRRCLWAVVIGAILPIVFIFTVIAVSGN